MSTIQPPAPYSVAELQRLYPDSLHLRQVQLVFRHGERTPVSPRFQQIGVPPYWPYCAASTHFSAAVFGPQKNWDQLLFRRQMETFGKNGEAAIAIGPRGENTGLCLLGELTDVGRETTLALGKRLRHLYVDQLGFLNNTLENSDHIYMRATPIQRALESLQQVFTGLFPPEHRAPDLTPPTILARSIAEENLLPNDSACRRYNQLSRAFGDLAAQKWNNSEEMRFLNSKIGKYMEGGVVAINGKPRLSGVLDSINSTLAHGSEVRLPSVFYEKEVMDTIEMMEVDEWFRGYAESVEYRRLGAGSLLGDVRDRQTQLAHGTIKIERGEEKPPLKVALMGCHDTTLAAILGSLGAFDNKWPPYTSHIAFELFSKKSAEEDSSPKVAPSGLTGWLGIFGSGAKKEKPEDLNGWYVRLRYNDVPVVVKGCKPTGKHLEGDKTFCTLEAFKGVVDKLAPTNWRSECAAIEQAGLPPVEYVE